MGYSYTLALNKFGDLTQDQYLSDNFRGFRPDLFKNMSEESLFVPPSGVHLPFKVDWRTKGFVSPVKDQGGYSSASSLSSIHGRALVNHACPVAKQRRFDPIAIFFLTECNVSFARGHQPDFRVMIPEAFVEANSKLTNVKEHLRGLNKTLQQYPL